MRKETFLIASILVFFILQTFPVFAEEPERLLNDVNQFERRENHIVQQNQLKQQNALQRQQNNLARSIKLVDAAIEKRINLLNRVLQRIQNDQHLSSDEKSNVSTDIQNDINGLTSLKAKIDADTDTATVRSDAKQIVTNFKIYEIAVPKARLLITIDNLQPVVNKISEFTPKIQDLINTLKSQGKDVTNLQSLLNDVNTRLSNLDAQLSSDKSTVMNVTTSTTDPKSVFTQVRQDLASVRQSLAQIRHDFGQMRDAFRIIITGGNSGNGSASVSPIPTPSATPTPTPTSLPI